MSIRRWIAFTVLLLVAGGSAWYYFGIDRDLNRARAARDALFSEENRDLSRDERRQQFAAYREQVEDLSDEQQQVLADEGRARMMERFERQMDEFFALSPEERVAYIDEQLDEMEERRQQWAQRRAESDNNGQGEQRRRGGRGWGGRGGSPDANARNEWRRSMLDHTTPEFRAKAAEYRRLWRVRMQERGQPGRSGRGWL